MSNSPSALIKGKYLFFTELEQLPGSNVLVPCFQAKALIIKEEGDILIAEAGLFEITNLISKLSVYTDQERTLEAHKLYTWPARLGDPKAWAESKLNFFNEHLLYHPIEILSVHQEDHYSWQYIKQAGFLASAESIPASAEFLGLVNQLSLKSKI